MMSGSKPTPVVFLLVLIFCLANSFKLSYSIGKKNIIFCPGIERLALLSFKQSLEDPANVLSSWNIGREVNCCKWKGVVCSNLTGHVHELHLPGDGQNSTLGGQINPLLLNLKHLRYLDLSQNYFGETIPSFIGSLTSLEYLNLSHAGFHGKIPRNIGNLSSLHTLSLEGDYLLVDTLEWLSGLSQLEHLNMNYVNLSKVAFNWVQVINTLPSLVELHFSYCSLNFMAPLSDVNITSLAILDLSQNNFESFAIPKWIFQLNNLIFLDLSWSKFEGPIPTTSNVTKLQYIDLSGNELNSSIPESIGQLSNLETLDIGDNMLEGVVSESHFANLTNLRFLSASGNHLTLNVSPNWIPPFKLDTLRLGSWNLGAGLPMPSWLDTQKNTMGFLDLSSTGISGNVPAWFWKINSLILSHNHLYGTIPDLIGGPKDYYFRLIYLNSNQFSGSLPQVGNTVAGLDLSNNSFSGGLSRFLCDMTNETYTLEILHLCGNRLTGELPDCLMKWPSLRVLNLGQNDISGSIPSSIGFLAHLRSLDLHRNKFSGQIPSAMGNCTKLVKIDLADNSFDGNIPTWMGTMLINLKIFILRSNKFGGEIHSSLCRINSLQILNLSNNSFSGIIPKCVNNFTAMATKRSSGDHDMIELDYCSWPGLVFLESASVVTKGNEYHYDTILLLVTNIDLSNNNLSGHIPKELTGLVELRSLNLSVNHLTGLIPESIGNMKQLESLDFSRNSLFGEIPNSFTVMSSLNYLNMSCNNLTGRIPESTQLLSMNASSFIGNNLCGPPLTNSCNYDDDEGPKEDNEDGKSN